MSAWILVEQAIDFVEQHKREKEISRMKVVYEKSVADKIRDIKQEAEKKRKKIEHILLTEDEAVGLYHTLPSSVGFFSTYPPRSQMCKIVNNGHFYGVLLKVEGYDD